MLTTTKTSEAIISQMIQSWDSTHIIPTRVGNVHVGQQVQLAHSHIKGIIQALAIVGEETYAWVEIPLVRGKAIHKGVSLADLTA